MSDLNGAALQCSNGGTVAEKPRPKKQEGSLAKKHGQWYVRYREWTLQENVGYVWREKWLPLGKVSEFTRPEINPVFSAFMEEKNRECEVGPDSSMFDFVEKIYLPTLKLAPSTMKGYKDIWSNHIKDRLKDDTLSTVRPVLIGRMLKSIVEESDLSKTTIAHIKHFVGGIFTFARQEGYFDGANPVTGIKLPKARGPQITHAYSLEEIYAMLEVLTGRARVAVAVAAWLGPGQSEFRAMRWEDRKGKDFFFQRNVWRTHIKETKTPHRLAPVPIIPVLRKILDEYWLQQGRPAEGWLFPASKSKLPMCPHNLYRREMEEPLLLADLEWHGWHAFRRGLATNLREMGVPDDQIQAILRHGDIQTTQRFYAKTVSPSVRKAMAKMDSKIRRDSRETAARQPA